MVTWKLRDYLDAHNVSAYALSKSTDLAPSTVYALARGDQGRVDLAVLDKVLAALEQLTGQTVTFNDLLERQRQDDAAILKEDEDLLLASGTADLQETLDEIEADLPAGEVDTWLESFRQAADANG